MTGRKSNISPEYWAGKKVFLTGHTGFKGSWLSQWLIDMGAIVRGYALEAEQSGVPEGFLPLFDELQLTDKMEHQVADVRDRASLKEALHTFQPEIVIHMAAQPLVRLSYREPLETYETNVMGTVHLLDACRDLASLKTICVVTSDKCYENREQIWGYRESDPMGGHDPYSNSKGCAELVVSSWRNSFFPPEKYKEHGVVLCSGRAGNVIGGGDWCEDRLIPDAMRALVRGNTLSIRRPNATRPWQHVIEPLSGYLRLIEKADAIPEIAAAGWNFGPADEMNLKVGDVIAKLAHFLNDGLKWEQDVDHNHVHEATLLKLDCTAAKEVLGWHAQFDAMEMLSMTAEWYHEKELDARREILKKQLDQVT